MKIKITPEYSAQRRLHAANPLMPVAFAFLEKHLKTSEFGNVCDLGCGKLRHFSILRKRSKSITLVDTEFQLSRAHQDGEVSHSVRDFVQALVAEGDTGILAMDSEQFERSSLNLDVIFLINVTDVVPSRTHMSIVKAAAKNLKTGGLLLVIFPRNDSSIISRFTKANRYQDGHYFQRGKVTTFIRNITDLKPLMRQLTSTGLTMLHEHIRYRQVMIVMQK